MTDWSTEKRKVLADAATRDEYERLGPLYEIIADAIRLRQAKGLSQEQLALKMGKQQPAIARFESGRVWPSLAFLQALASALDAKLTVRLTAESAPGQTRVAVEAAPG